MSFNNHHSPSLEELISAVVEWRDSHQAWFDRERIEVPPAGGQIEDINRCSNAEHNLMQLARRL